MFRRLTEGSGGPLRQIDAEDLEIEAIDGTVLLAGTVKTWAEHDAAVDAAWAAPGVREVKDQLVIGY